MGTTIIEIKQAMEPKSNNTGAKGIADQRQTILMVDDARFFRELMTDLLKERDVRVLTADNAADATRLLRVNTVDLLIVDINLPDKNGLDLIREIRLEDRFSELAILCISGVYRKEDDAIKALRAGADDFITKPPNPQEQACEDVKACY